MKTKLLTMRIDPLLDNEITDIAEKLGDNKSRLIHKALASYIYTLRVSGKLALEEILTNKDSGEDIRQK